jgi:phospholipase C
LLVDVSEDIQLQRVERIVALMLENRSFDHMPGCLSLERGCTSVDGALGRR